jgi:DNA-binding CsgD family transcriptional regulator
MIAPLGFPFDLCVAVFEEDGCEWALFSYATEAAAALTHAEQDVLARVLAGHSNAAIARARGTSPRTVANQIAALLRRFELGSRRALIARFAGGANDHRASALLE